MLLFVDRPVTRIYFVAIISTSSTDADQKNDGETQHLFTFHRRVFLVFYHTAITEIQIYGFKIKSQIQFTAAKHKQ